MHNDNNYDFAQSRLYRSTSEFHDKGIEKLVVVPVGVLFFPNTLGRRRSANCCGDSSNGCLAILEEKN